MRPLKLSASALARAILVPRSRVSEILSGRRGISTDTAARLGLLFQVGPEVFLNRQISWDHAHLDLPEIEPMDTSRYLVGPEGVTPIPSPTTTDAPGTANISESMLKRLRTKANNTPDNEPRTLVEVRWASGQRAVESKPQ